MVVQHSMIEITDGSHHFRVSASLRSTCKGYPERYVSVLTRPTVSGWKTSPVMQLNVAGGGERTIALLT